MSKLLSNEGYLGIAKQTSKGNPAAASLAFVKFEDGSFTTEQTNTPLRESGDGQYIHESIKTAHREKFQYKCRARPDIVAYVFAYLLGEDTKSGGSDPYTHVLTRGSSRIWHTLFRKITTSVVQRIEDCKISTITIEGDAGKEVMITVDGEGCGATILSSEESEVYEDRASVFKFFHGAGTFKIGGTVSKNIKKFVIKFTITGEPLMTDELIPGDIPDLQFNVDVSLEVYATDTTEWKKANYNNQTTPQDVMYSDSVSIDLNFTDVTTAKNRQLKIEIPAFQWNSVNIPMKGSPEVVTQTIAGIALKQDASELVTVTVQNDLSQDLAGSGS